MNRLIMFLMSFILLFTISCDSDSDNIVGGGIIDEPELIGCEATTFYDWSDFEFSTSLDAGNGQEVGIVTEGIYYLEITNTRPGRLDFDFSIALNDIVYGCMNDDALNYDNTANVDDGSCEFNDCNTAYYQENYGEMILDCDGNCAPLSWVADGYCDDGAWAILDEEGNQVPVNLYCAELNFDEGDCEAIDEDCTPGLIEDCNGICAPQGWLGDGFCDDGSYEYNGNPIFFNCEEFDFDNGDCESLGRQTPRVLKGIFIGH